MNVLLVGRTPAVIADVLDQVEAPAVTFYTGSSLEDVMAVLERTQVDHVIVGGGLDVDTRLQIVRSVFESSTSTTCT
jgi:3-phosphoglycerate kinase